jgi:putative hemolysin
MPMTTAEKETSSPIFSFANGELGPLSSAFIRGIEKVTGQPLIKKLYLDYVNDDRPNHLFWQDAVDRLQLKVNVHHDLGAHIPKTGRLLVIANHPFGVIDGLILCSEISKVRQDYKIITHQVLRQAPAVMHQILPIDFDTTEEALKTNMETRKSAVQQINDGGVVILFPSGAISLPKKIIGPAADAEWKTFAAKLALIEDTTVLPVFFNGQNSLSYVLARRMSQTLGYSLMFREICRRIGTTVDVQIRKPITPDLLKTFSNRNDVTAYLRACTYGEANDG